MIAGAAAILAPILAVVAKSYLDQRDLLPLSKARRNTVIGLWVGTLTYRVSAARSGELDDLEVDFRRRHRLLLGTARYTHSGTGERVTLLLRGGFYHDNFIMCQYRQGQGMMQFGSIILELSPDARELTGYLVGFGRESRALVVGDLVLTKGQ